MSPYALCLLALLVALLAQSVATAIALEQVVRRPYDAWRRAWLIAAVACGLSAFQLGSSLEQTLRTGIFDLRQATLSALVSLLLAWAMRGLRLRPGSRPGETPPPR